MNQNIINVITIFASSDELCSQEPDESRNKSKLLVVSIVIMLILYTMLLLLLISNTRHITRKSKYKNFHLSFFYIMAYAIITLRIIFFGAILEFVIHQLDNGNNTLAVPSLINTIDSIATYAELILGIQQMCSMIELYLMLRFSFLYQIN